MSIIKNVKRKKKKEEKEKQRDQFSGSVVLCRPSVSDVVKILPNHQEGTETGKESI